MYISNEHYMIWQSVVHITFVALYNANKNKNNNNNTRLDLWSLISSQLDNDGRRRKKYVYVVVNCHNFLSPNKKPLTWLVCMFC